MSALARAVLIAIGFLVPAIIVYVILRRAWPAQHDLSDVGTGLVRVAIVLAVGVTGAIVTNLLIRRR